MAVNPLPRCNGIVYSIPTCRLLNSTFLTNRGIHMEPGAVQWRQFNRGQPNLRSEGDS